MQRLLACFLMAIFASSTLADAPSLTLPSKVTGKPGAFLTVAATTTGKNVAWLSLDPGLNLFPTHLLKDTRTAVVTSGRPGTYRLMAVTAANDEISTPAVCQIVIEGDTPPAPPAPAPGPQPNPSPAPPSPASRVSWAIVILDNSMRTPALGQLVGSPTLQAALKQAQISYRVLDVHDPLIVQLNYGPAINAAGGPPALLLFDSRGKRIKAIALPADEKSFCAAVGIPCLA